MSLMAGANSLRTIEVFIGERRAQLNELFGTDWRKAPSWVGLRKFLLQLDEHDLESAVRAFAQKQVCAPPGRQFIALDGKALRGSASRLEDMTARHIVSAFDQQGLIVLGHVEVAEKSNEIPAAQALIESLGLQGRGFTMDALHCQKNASARPAKAGRRAGAGQGQPANLACRL
ncbi:ISAs1 family transposase [Paraburkholderia sediminicola]